MSFFPSTVFLLVAARPILGHYERIRSPNVKFRVGDIVYHKILGYRAVIIGWDEKAMAPKEFIQQVHRGKSEWTNNPNYAVAIDLRDRMNPQIGYVVQENLELSKGRVLQIITAKYFEKFDEHRNRYVMRPFMREFYPDD
ncbi:unnamed protein product [Caenorhabditis angaria]|uniref:Hemimethylated DNA-binding domain-containing protein n=1 Tax=Caenorhabditis angaria TaxID=860376 RepID=A0A9P1MS68_9PELO|nr:unnamed protein product [Caenorhabditis angaria]